MRLFVVQPKEAFTQYVYIVYYHKFSIVSSYLGKDFRRVCKVFGSDYFLEINLTNQCFYVNIIITSLNSVLNIHKICNEKREEKLKNLRITSHSLSWLTSARHWDVQNVLNVTCNVLIECVESGGRSETQPTICFVRKLYTSAGLFNDLC